MKQELLDSHRRFYEQTLNTLERQYKIPEDTCYVLVQHAFSPSLHFFDCIKDKIAAIIPKRSSANSNPEIVIELQNKFPGQVHQNISRCTLQDSGFATQFLREVTGGRPFLILEYGGYFAPAAQAISEDPMLRNTLKGFVEGTENGIKGSDDGSTVGYKNVAHLLKHPVVSKSRSKIKTIMDIEIGPAIVHATNEILRRNIGCTLKHWRGNIGVIGVGAIGHGILKSLDKDSINPLVFDTNLAVMATLANHNSHVVNQQAILQHSDVIFLNTGSCFLSETPALIKMIKNNAILVLCTSGDVEAGIPQLIADGTISLIDSESTVEIAVYKSIHSKRIRLVLGSDGVGQAPNMSLKDGSSSPANLMSDMEFCGIGNYLASAESDLKPGTIHPSPDSVEDLILKEWLREFHPQSIDHKNANNKNQRTNAVAHMPVDPTPEHVTPTVTPSC